MRLGFTEFSFGYAFTENLIRWRWNLLKPCGAPSFPNLVQEAILGYDVKVDMPGFALFFQFKLPQLMVLKTAREIAKLALPIKPPFYRMPLMPKKLSDQHQNLVDLEEGCHTNSVFYATPALSCQNEFNCAYNNAEVHLKSALFSPKDIGRLPDEEQHSIVFEDFSNAWFCSEIKEIDIFRFETIWTKLMKKQGSGPTDGLMKSVQETMESVKKTMRNIHTLDDGFNFHKNIRRHIREKSLVIDSGINTEKREVLVEILSLREIARIGLGCELFFVQPEM